MIRAKAGSAPRYMYNREFTGIPGQDKSGDHFHAEKSKE
jgi:hypothetical protein